MSIPTPNGSTRLNAQQRVRTHSLDCFSEEASIWKCDVLGKGPFCFGAVAQTLIGITIYSMIVLTTSHRDQHRYDAASRPNGRLVCAARFSHQGNATSFSREDTIARRTSTSWQRAKTMKVALTNTVSHATATPLRKLAAYVRHTFLTCVGRCLMS